jgi:filamin
LALINIFFCFCFQQRLLGWVKDKLPADLPVNNFTSDWNNGKAVGALVDSVAPGLCPDWEDWDPNRPLENAREAMDLADQVIISTTFL